MQEEDTEGAAMNATGENINQENSGDDHFYKEFANIDIEEQIPWSTIRKCIADNAPLLRRKDISENVPLLVRDVLKLNPGHGFKSVITFRGIHFRTVTIYGQAARTGTRYNKDATLYTVDDGTESVIVYYPASTKRKQIEFKGIADKLQYELNIFKKHKTKDRSPQLIKSLEVMIQRIKKQIYLPSENFKPGTKISVIGVPYKPSNMDSVRLYALEITSDDGVNRDKEIFFKDHLVQFYSKKFVPKGKP